MSLHRLCSMEVGVPNPQDLAGFYAEAGLADDGSGRITSPDGGAEVTITEAPYRQLLAVTLGASDERDLDLVATRLRDLGLEARGGSGAGMVSAIEPTTAVRFEVVVAAPVSQRATAVIEPNGPAHTVRANRRAPAVYQQARPPRRLGHIVIGTPDIAATRRFLVEGIGCKVSDEIEGIIAFLRCSRDHHNIGLVGSPVPILQHYSWECDDIDHVGHTATKLLRADADRHAWGLGRHFAGSNFYWYLRDPAGSFMELYSDLDAIDDDDAWEAERGEFGFDHIANSWGPEIPMEFIVPTDLPALQAAWAAR